MSRFLNEKEDSGITDDNYGFKVRTRSYIREDGIRVTENLETGETSYTLGSQRLILGYLLYEMSKRYEKE